MLADIETITKVCGIGSYLQLGCADHCLVPELLKRSLDAYGIDASSEVVERYASTAQGRFQVGSLLKYPYEKKLFDTLIIGSELLNFSFTDLNQVLLVLQEITKRHLVLYFSPETLKAMKANKVVNNRLFWEDAFIKAGFRKHPRSMLATAYQQLENEQTGSLTFFECVPDLAQEKFPLTWLAKNRDLHMDMLREAGRRSDGHVSRYLLAATMIRPGDVVLDAACGLGYGTAVLAACSPGARFIGVDIDDTSIEYAKANYAANNPALSYLQSDVIKLSCFADHSVDAIVSFETIEHVKDYDALLAELKRVLKPDGRFVGSVPNLWCDETGEDPNPYHFHVFDWNKLQTAIGKYFIVDGRWSQTAGGGYRLNQGHREMEYIPLSQDKTADCEWWLISACGNPLDAKAVPYTNPFHRQGGAKVPEHIYFEKYYDNPWLYRVMVQLGERLIDRDALFDLCSKVEKDARIGSADQGAALCVLCYQLFESRNFNLGFFSALVDRINLFDKTYDEANPHAHRWAISLYYIISRLLLLIGNREEALKTFITCAELDPLRFSPLLATKTISARFYAGMVLLGNRKPQEAREQFKLGIKESHRVLQGDWHSILGDFDHPLAFGLPEAAEVLEIASQCIQALQAIDRQETSPGYLWSRINLKRFGLLEWNKYLERENEFLRKRLFTNKIGT